MAVQSRLCDQSNHLELFIDALGPSRFDALLTSDGILVDINRAPLEASGLHAEDVIGRPFAETQWWTWSPDVQQQLREAIVRAAHGEPSRYDARTRGADGRFSDLDFSLRPLRDGGERVALLVASASVITERKQAESALRQSLKLEAVGRLAAGVAHEFNNILQALMAMATLARMRAVTPESMQIATDMEAQIRRGAAVTQQLLLASRHQDLTRRTFDMRDQVADTRDLLRRRIPENITLVVECTAERATVEGDAGQNHQVLHNLVINARDAMPEGGSLTLRVTCEDGEVRLEAEDDGVGLDDATREHLFEPFFTTKQQGKGTGLGLAVAYGIVEQHGGGIEVVSGPGAGSLFRVILPEADSGTTALDLAPGANFRTPTAASCSSKMRTACVKVSPRFSKRWATTSWPSRAVRKPWHYRRHSGPPSCSPIVLWRPLTGVDKLGHTGRSLLNTGVRGPILAPR